MVALVRFAPRCPDSRFHGAVPALITVGKYRRQARNGVRGDRSANCAPYGPVSSNGTSGSVKRACLRPAQMNFGPLRWRKCYCRSVKLRSANCSTCLDIGPSGRHPQFLCDAATYLFPAEFSSGSHSYTALAASHPTSVHHSRLFPRRAPCELCRRLE
jgi:hypothetical protein